MTFVFVAFGLWLAAAFFTWALCKAASDADDALGEAWDEEGWRP